MFKRSFQLQDQLLFAKLSGDYNPMHLDPRAARRLLYGEPVVHGIHLLMWALEKNLEQLNIEHQLTGLTIVNLRVSFPAALRLEQVVNIRFDNQITTHDLTSKLSLSSQGIQVAQIEIEWQLQVSKSGSKVQTGLPPVETPSDQNFSELSELSELRGQLELYLDDALAEQMFPRLMRSLPSEQFAMLLASTRLVGMKCPGLHSVFSELRFQQSADWSKSSLILDYAATRFDPRFSLLQLEIGGAGLKGMIKSFVRPAPTVQAELAEVQVQLQGAEFAGQRALIIGGSRGLGEVCAKILALGQADVKLSCFKGEAEAEQLSQSLRVHGSQIDWFRYDVLNPGKVLDQLLADWVPTHVYFFATPFIFSGSKGVFLPEKFDAFCAYYLSGFLSVFDVTYSAGCRRYFHPSSSAIDELPTNSGEYTAAKAAGESLAAHLEKSHPGLKIAHPRLPRLATDQTASVFPVQNLDPLPVMLEHLRDLQA